MYITVTEWTWNPGNTSPVPSSSQVIENCSSEEAGLSLAMGLLTDAKRAIGITQPVTGEPCENGTVWIVGGDHGQELRAIYLELTQTPPDIVMIEGSDE